MPPVKIECFIKRKKAFKLLALGLFTGGLSPLIPGVALFMMLFLLGVVFYAKEDIKTFELHQNRLKFKTTENQLNIVEIGESSRSSWLVIIKGKDFQSQKPKTLFFNRLWMKKEDFQRLNQALWG